MVKSKLRKYKCLIHEKVFVIILKSISFFDIVTYFWTNLFADHYSLAVYNMVWNAIFCFLRRTFKPLNNVWISFVSAH